MIPTILIIGASGLIAQVIILRELLVSFYGNELTLGVILANWMLLEAGGVYFVGRLVDRVKEKTSLLVILQLVFAWGFIAAIYFARTFKYFSGAFFGQGLNLGSIYLYAFLAMLPIGFSHGALFGVSCRIFQKNSQEPYQGINKVYTWETIGSILSGILLTYVLIPFFSSFQLAQLLALVNLTITLIYVKPVKSLIFRYGLWAALLFSLFFFIGLNPDHLQSKSLRLQYRSEEIVDYRNSVYANIAVTRNLGQHTLFYNGLPAATIPDPDISSIEEFGHLPLLFHPHPQKVLLLGSGLGGLIREILKHPLNKLDYLELDPAILGSLKIADPEYIAQEVIDPRLEIINQDSRLFLRRSKEKYDLILLGLTGPTDLVSNRLFTEEFFALAKDHLKKEGIIAFRLSGSMTYLSPQLRDLNFSVINSLKAKFAYVRVLPGYLNLILGSDSSYMAGIDAQVVNRGIQQLDLQTKMLVLPYLESRINQQWLDWFNNASLNATLKKNRDFTPRALFQALLIWNRQFSPAAAGFFEKLADFNLYKAVAVILGIFLIFLFSGSVRKKKSGNLALVYSLGSSGFWAMMVNLEMVFAFQVSFGYIYKAIGLLIAVFMAGIALASAVTTKKISREGFAGKYLLAIEVTMVIFSLFLSGAITRGITYSFGGMAIFVFLFFASGYFLGAEFALCAKMYQQNRSAPGNTAGILYSADLLGGCLAGFLGGIWLLPILGIGSCGLVLSLIKATSFALLKKNINKG